jgi:hypothetical protein
VRRNFHLRNVLSGEFDYEAQSESVYSVEEDLSAQDLVDFSPVYRCLHIHTVLDAKETYENYYRKQRKKQARLALQPPTNMVGFVIPLTCRIPVVTSGLLFLYTARNDRRVPSIFPRHRRLLRCGRPRHEHCQHLSQSFLPRRCLEYCRLQNSLFCPHSFGQ